MLYNRVLQLTRKHSNVIISKQHKFSLANAMEVLCGTSFIIFVKYSAFDKRWVLCDCNQHSYCAFTFICM